MSISIEYANIKKLLEAAGEDVAKSDAGNKAATTRARKQLQVVRVALGELRASLLKKEETKA